MDEKKRSVFRESAAYHEACREIGAIIARVEFQHRRKVSRVGFYRDSGEPAVWLQWAEESADE
jgi:hypothetical protein